MFKRTNTQDVFHRLIEQIEPDHNDAAEIFSATVDDATTEDPPPPNNDDNPAAADDVEPGEDNEPQTEQNDTRTPIRHRSRILRIARHLAVVCAGALLVAALGASAFLGWQLKQRNDTATAGRVALDVARRYAVTLSSIDANGIDKNFAEVLDGATGEFKNMYSQSSAQLRQLLIDNKAVSHGTVIDAAIQSATNTKVDTLLFVDQSISNAANPEPRIDRLRIKITMELNDSRWLASHVEIL